MKPNSTQQEGEVPQEMMNKIVEWLEPFFPEVPIENCTGPVDYEQRNTLQRHKRNCLRKGAIFGYNLAKSQPVSVEPEGIAFYKDRLELVSTCISALMAYNNQYDHSTRYNELRKIKNTITAALSKPDSQFKTPSPVSEDEK